MNANIRNVDLNLLVVLDALYEERSVTLAAERLSLTQPTVSGMLKRLRSIFDDDLYIRTSHGIIPTPRAEELAKPTKEFIAAAQSLLVQEKFDPAVAEFAVKLCGSDYVQNTILGAFGGEILMRAPNSKISMQRRPLEDAEKIMARGDIDFLFGAGDIEIPDLPSQFLFAEKMICISSYEHHREGQSIPVEEVCSCRNARLNQTGAPVSSAIDNKLHTMGLKRNIVLRIPSFAALFQSMRHGEFIAFIPEQLAHQNAGQFKVVQTEFDKPHADVVAYWHPRMTNDARHIWLREVLQIAVQKTLGQ